MSPILRGPSGLFCPGSGYGLRRHACSGTWLDTNEAPPLSPTRPTEKERAQLLGWTRSGTERRGFLKPDRMYEVRTTPSAFPALGHDVGIDYCTHSMDLLAQKIEFFVLTSSGHSFRESN